MLSETVDVDLLRARQADAKKLHPPPRSSPELVPCSYYLFGDIGREERQDKKETVCGAGRQFMWLQTTEGMWLHTTDGLHLEYHQSDPRGLSRRPLYHDDARALEVTQYPALHVPAYTQPLQPAVG